MTPAEGRRKNRRFSSSSLSRTLRESLLKDVPNVPKILFIFISDSSFSRNIRRDRNVTYLARSGRFPLLLYVHHSATLQTNMPPKRFDNYIRMLRRQRGLSQDELASLLGWKSGSAVSRLERGRRKPSLETLLALEAIFGVPIREFYAGRFQKVETAVKERVELFISAHEENFSLRKGLRDLLAAITHANHRQQHDIDF
jgi:transcriptional regulator with XRE-family HTH domain